jgi:hypothetical protein
MKILRRIAQAFSLLFLTLNLSAQQYIIFLGTSPNDGTGTPARTVGADLNSMFSQIYVTVITNSTPVSLTNVMNVLAGNGANITLLQTNNIVGLDALLSAMQAALDPINSWQNLLTLSNNWTKTNYYGTNVILNGTINIAPNEVFGATYLLTGSLGDARYGLINNYLAMLTTSNAWTQTNAYAMNVILNGTNNTASNEVFGAYNILIGSLGDARYGELGTTNWWIVNQGLNGADNEMPNQSVPVDFGTLMNAGMVTNMITNLTVTYTYMQTNAIVTNFNTGSLGTAGFLLTSVGVNGKSYWSGQIAVTNVILNGTNVGALTLNDSTGTNSGIIQAPHIYGSNSYTLILPTTISNSGVLYGTQSGTNVTLAFTNTPSVFSLVQTNLISGFVYSNSSGSIQFVSANAEYSPAAISGDAGLDLRITGVGGVTNHVGEATSSSTLALNHTNILSGVIPINGTYTFTNVCIGVGNSASIDGGQVLTY